MWWFIKQDASPSRMLPVLWGLILSLSTHRGWLYLWDWGSGYLGMKQLLLAVPSSFRTTRKVLFFSHIWTVALISENFCHRLYPSDVCFMIRHTFFMTSKQACTTTTETWEAFSFALHFQITIDTLFYQWKKQCTFCLWVYSSFTEGAPAKGMKQRFLLWPFSHAGENRQPHAAFPCPSQVTALDFLTCVVKEDLEATQRDPVMPWCD